VAFGLRNHGLRKEEAILSYECAGDCAGHYYLLGRANDHRRSRV